ncbi:MAG: group III truncated hemoglobin [Chitinophagaceae bacterium]
MPRQSAGVFLLVSRSERKEAATQRNTTSSLRRSAAFAARNLSTNFATKKSALDISTRSDIENLLLQFYGKVKTDPVIGYIFTDIAHVNWEHHIPIITDFWETILLDNPVYKKNAMEVHYALNRQEPLTPAHFERWLQLFNETIDELYQGKIADLAKTRARSIAGLMQHKMK